MPASPKPLVITLGEPAGIGPDVILLAWRALRETADLTLAAIGDAAVLQNRARALKLAVPVEVVESLAQADAIFAQALPVLHQPLPCPDTPGRPQAAHAPLVVNSIRTAAELTLAGQARALVTGPVNKAALYAHGFAFQGHTDYLGHLAQMLSDEPVTPVMMLVGGGLRTVPVTVHIPLSKVAKTLTSERIDAQIRITAKALHRHFAINNPHIGVAGLNPHAGEDGALGVEERLIITPAIEALSRDGYRISGPLPADTIFHEEARRTFDAVICMYHDQALIPVKTCDFWGAVNVTLGLPMVRTSPDHGTALALAGTGRANPSSMIAAIRLAAQMTR